jgi:hypothetical protein
MPDVHRDSAQDFDPARTHSEGLVDFAGNQLRLVHEQLSAVNLAIVQERDGKKPPWNALSRRLLPKVGSSLSYDMPSDCSVG